MFFKIISQKFVDGIDELVYEVSCNDSRYFFVRKSVYEKFNSGEYSLSYDKNGFTFMDKYGKVIPKVKDVF